MNTDNWWLADRELSGAGSRKLPYLFMALRLARCSDVARQDQELAVSPPAQAEVKRRAPIFQGESARHRHHELPVGDKLREVAEHVIAQNNVLLPAGITDTEPRCPRPPPVVRLMLWYGLLRQASRIMILRRALPPSI
jgi:hypothetical protein